MSGQCLYSVGAKMCIEERALDYDFCVNHLNTPRGRQHVLDVVNSGNLTRASDVERVIAQAREIPDADPQTTALMEMIKLVEEISNWTDDAHRRLNQIPESEWRYHNRSRDEQVRTEVLVYERALDRQAKVLQAVSKMALSEKIVSLGRAQTELMIKMLLRVIDKLSMPGDMSERARLLLLEGFKNEARLEPRLMHHTTKQLVLENGSDIAS